jgi:hypothetical protein
MTMLLKTIAVVAACGAVAAGAFAQGHSGGHPASALVPAENEPAPKLFVDAPLPGPLARGAVLITYRVENFRILPVLGMAAVSVSPRVGHLHVTVDDLPWRWGEFSDTNTIVVVGLPPGEHKVLIELADPEHRVLAGQAVTFTVPAPAK